MKDLFAPEVTEDQKSVIVAVKMPKSLRDQFNALCESKGVNMSLVIRRFMEAQINEAAK